jgi:hypothetical protein
VTTLVEGAAGVVALATVEAPPARAFAAAPVARPPAFRWRAAGSGETPTVITPMPFGRVAMDIRRSRDATGFPPRFADLDQAAEGWLASAALASLEVRCALSRANNSIIVELWNCAIWPGASPPSPTRPASR